MKVLISVLAAIVILTSCEFDSTGSKSTPENTPRTGQKIEPNSSNLAKSIAGRAYCSTVDTVLEDGTLTLTKYLFYSDGTGAVLSIKKPSGAIYYMDKFDWGASENTIVMNGKDLDINYQSSIQDNILSMGLLGSSNKFEECGTFNAPNSESFIITDRYICDEKSGDKFIFRNDGSLEVEGRNFSTTGTYIDGGNDRLVLSFNGDSILVYYKRLGLDKVEMRFYESFGNPDTQVLQSCFN